MKIMKIVFSTIIICYLSSAVLVYFFQDQLLYQPSEEYLHNYPIRYFSNEEQTLKSVVLNPGKEKAILYFGGSGESIADSASLFVDVFQDQTMYLINYRGYGGSTGEPGEAAFFSDSVAIYDELSLDHSDISVIGYSLGSGIAMNLAAKRTLNSVTLVAPYDSMISVAQELYPFYPVSLMLKDKFNSVDRVNDVEEKTLIIIAEKDEDIPYKLSDRLINAFPSDQLIVNELKNVNHESVLEEESLYETLNEFINN